MTNIYQDKVLILDFGSQYTQLIARRVRELGVYCQIHSCLAKPSVLRDFAAKAVILSGGPDTVTTKRAARIPEVVFEMNVPILAICYGMQAMAVQLGGRAKAAKKHEYGFAKVRLRGHSDLFASIKGEANSKGEQFLNVWMSHGIEVSQLPTGFKRIASSDNCVVAGFADEKRHYYGLQFHPEVTHSQKGKQIIKRFLQISGCQSRWRTRQIVNQRIDHLKAVVAEKKVLLALSGGVDSSVVAMLLSAAIGKQLICVFVDHGLLRLNEADEVMETFASQRGIKVIRVNAKKRFLNALKGVSDPEKKRRIIGREFIKVFEEQAQRLKDITFLAQGTIYPDVIESAASGGDKTKVIKSHHNVGGLPKRMRLRLLEPLKELFKDEVRQIGVKLGLPKAMLYRHPFPGPGLAVRVLGEIKAPYLPILKQADDIFIKALRQRNYYDKVSQAFAVFLPIKSVGVTGDGRRYDYVIALRAVATVDFMTASWARLPQAFLDEVATRIINEVPHISRVVYDISGKPPATIEWE